MMKYALGLRSQKRQLYLCGPRTTLKTDKMQKFSSCLAYFQGFYVNCGPQKLFSPKLLPAEHFFFKMWPSDQ
jgi:hypothetical protein